MNRERKSVRPATSSSFKWGAGALAVFISVLIALPIAGRLDPVLGDLVVLNLMPKAYDAEDQIVVVTITEETLAKFPYRSPIDRGFLADLITVIDAAQPASIGLDILLDSTSEPEKDRRLFAALSGAQKRIVLASVSDDFLTEGQAEQLKLSLSFGRPGSVKLQRDDADGVLRHLPQLHDEGMLLLTEAMAGRRFSETPFASRILYQVSRDGTPVLFPKYPAHTVELLPQEWFRNKHVLIGTDLPGVDRHPTPLVSVGGTAAGSMAGIEVHAHLLGQLLSSRNLPVPTFTQAIGILMAAALAAAFGFLTVRQPSVFFSGLILAALLYLGLATALIAGELFMLPILSPIAAAGTSVLLLSLVHWRQERLERAFVLSAFEKYVSPEVVRRLASGEVELALGGQKRIVTYLFTDLAGFTSLSENLPPDQVADILNGYLDDVCDVVFRHGATLDKLIGDAVVCFFGAPEDDPKQASKAVALALELDATAQRYRQRLADQGIALGVTRIGIHLGEAVIGNFGGNRFFDYTGIGDTVNTAARLEGVNKYLGSRICVSETVVENCREQTAFAFRPLGALVLKGRQQGLACYEPMSANQAGQEWFGAYCAAYEAMRRKESNVQTLFERVLAKKGNDGPTNFHLARLNSGQTGEQVVFSDK
ncbi:adenylate cyclase [Roseibium hamelinense]|uniref:Adenylate cyclase n=1 Tax=Roseibium hamelinense TaxID=150831 RepID=A0A562SZ56_9HYPH|nr:adenylate/guanylate cyclase domain-containing protein [Roseibium hamelinense]MTI44758.1 adenylate/guanylate cyclase domain-containing protein [Roseibium hamelinense]TWI86056.1 adenylate cyclase [Roseibium hamelinense]